MADILKGRQPEAKQVAISLLKEHTGMTT